MAVAATLDAGRRPSVLAALRRRPTIGAEVAVVVAWLALVALLFGSHGIAHHQSGRAMPAMAGMPGMPGMPASFGAASFGGAAAAGIASLPMWALMCVAMMLPATIPAVDYVAANSFAWRRRRAMFEFVVLYLGIWVAFGAVTFTVLAWWAPSRTTVILAVVLALAAGWQLTGTKRRAILQCHRTSPLPPRGWPATVGVARFAARNGGACLLSGWAMMLVMVVPGSGALPWMVLLTGIMSAEKLARKPRRATRYAAAVLGAAAVGVALVAAIS